MARPDAPVPPDLYCGGALSSMHFIKSLNDILWGPWAFFALMGAGILFTIWSKMVQYRALTHGVRVIRGVYDDDSDPGAITHFQALSAALSATVGLGNIGGVALAIAAGGPGSLFWMWVIGFFGMALKAIEVTLAMMFRNTDDPDNPHGGAMWVVKRPLGERGGAIGSLATAFAGFFCVTLIISTITGGNMFQAWNVAQLTEGYFAVPTIVTSIVLAVLVGLVIVGGIKRIGKVASRLVPSMIAVYILAGLAVIAVNIEQIPTLMAAIVDDALSPTQGTGAFLGASAYYGFSIGLRRALFSNEAGQGSAPIAHAAAKTDEPAREGIVGGLEPFIDTILICTLTALVILSTGTWNRSPDAPIEGAIDIVELPADTEADGESAEDASTWVVTSPHIVRHEAIQDELSWREGIVVYMVGVVTGAHDPERASNRVRIGGTLHVVGDEPPEVAALAPSGLAPGDLWVSWDPIDLSGWDGEATAVAVEDHGVYQALDGAPLTAAAFDRAFPGVGLGKWIVTLAAWLFAFSTMISWSYYGEQGIVFLFGDKGVLPYKLLFLLAAVVSPIVAGDGDELGVLIDLGTGAMLWANIPIVIGLGYLAVGCLNDYFKRLKTGEISRRGDHEARWS